MHEYSIVEQLIDSLCKQLDEQGINQVKKIHLRRGSTFAEEPLYQAFEMLSKDTPLEKAELVIDEYQVVHKCQNCGFEESVDTDDLIGHIYVCPECGMSEEIAEAHGLELIEVVT